MVVSTLGGRPPAKLHISLSKNHMFMWFFFLSLALECSLTGEQKQPMNHAGPIFDPATQYSIEVMGQVDLEWLQSFDSSIEILVEDAGQTGHITMLYVSTDQSGMIGLLRRLHGLGMTIQQLQILEERRKE